MKKEIPILFLILIFSVSSVLFFKPILIISVFLFFGLPVLYLALKMPDRRKVLRVFIFSFIGAFTLGLAVDYLGFLNHAWIVFGTVFPFKFFSLVPIEDPIWSFFWACLIGLSYESFSKTGNKSLLSYRAKYFIYVIALGSIIYLALFMFDKPLLGNIPYYYFSFGVVLTLIPTLIFFYLHKKYIRPFLTVALYVDAVSFAYEVVALKLGYWTFPGQYVSWIQVFNVRFPFEELFFYILIGSIFALCYYEFFDGDTL